MLLDSGGTKAALAPTPKSVSGTPAQTSYKKDDVLLDANAPRLQQRCDACICEEYWSSHSASPSSLDFKYGTDSLGEQEKLIRAEESEVKGKRTNN